MTRSDGSWTYGKILEYDSLGDTYTGEGRAEGRRGSARALAFAFAPAGFRARAPATPATPALVTDPSLAPLPSALGAVQTKVGPKYFVERASITDDIVTNPYDGSCAQQ